MKTRSWLERVSRYRFALAAYVARGGEEELQQAYELGRRALEDGLGVLDLVRLHHEALSRPAAAQEPAAPAEGEARPVESFLMEALWPFEVAQRGFRDTSERLRGAYAAMEQ